MTPRLRVLVVCGGPSSEHEISLKTGAMILGHLNPRRYRATRAVIAKNGDWKFDVKNIEQKRFHITDAVLPIVRAHFDFVFIALHGAFGEDGCLQAILETIGVPYSGSGVLSSAMAMDKHISNMLYLAHGLRVPRYVIFGKNEKNKKMDIRFPVIVKPVAGGSSIGITLVKNKDMLSRALRTALKVGERAMIQEYVKGREFTCGVIEGKKGNPIALSPTEIIPRVALFFNYRAKYATHGSEEITPPRLPARKVKELQELALCAHRILGCSGISRSDFVLRGKDFFILETNTIPGMTETSLLPQAARAVGIVFPSLLDLIIQAGLRKKN